MRLSLKVRERRRVENDARAARIMAAAARVFSRRGVENATMEMIAREAKVAVGTIYLHFASRDEVYLSLCNDRGKQLAAHYREVIGRGLKPLEEIRALAQVYIDYLHESADPILLSEHTPYYEIRRRLRRASEIRTFDSGSRTRQAAFHLFESSVKRAFDKGMVADSLGATGVTVMIWSILNGAFMVTRDREYLVQGIGFDPEGFIARALDSYLHGLIAAARGSVRQENPARRTHRTSVIAGKGAGL